MPRGQEPPHVLPSPGSRRPVRTPPAGVALEGADLTMSRESYLLDLESHVLRQMMALEREERCVRDFHSGRFPSEACFVRSLVEDVLRMQENDEVDLLCLNRIGFEDRPLAIALLDYLREEATHADLLIHDLSAFGLTPEAVALESPLFSTQLLIGYLHRAIYRHGPLPSLVWAWFVEWYSEQYNPRIMECAQTLYGAHKLQGTLAHMRIDDREKHCTTMANLLEARLVTRRAQQEAAGFASHYIRLVGMYYRELFEVAVTWRPGHADSFRPIKSHDAQPEVDERPAATS
jgi:hypothetical protein